MRGTQQLLPQVRQFQSWATSNGYPQLEGFVKPVLPLASGGSRTVRVKVTNNDSESHSGEVSLDLPDGFAAQPVSRAYDSLAPGTSTSVAFRVTNTDDSLPTSNAGGVAGDYDYTITTTVDGGGSSDTTPALELVPTTTIEAAAQAPVVDGTVDSGEYAGEPLNLSRLWEGTPCDSTADCAATGHVTRHGNRLFVGVEVTDDTLGTPLAAQRLQATLAHRLGRDRHRPERRLGEHGEHVQDGGAAAYRRQRPAATAARATSATPTITRGQVPRRRPASTSPRRSPATAG